MELRRGQKIRLLDGQNSCSFVSRDGDQLRQNTPLSETSQILFAPIKMGPGNPVVLNSSMK